MSTLRAAISLHYPWVSAAQPLVTTTVSLPPTLPWPHGPMGPGGVWGVGMGQEQRGEAAPRRLQAVKAPSLLRGAGSHGRGSQLEDIWQPLET